ncbi:MAG: hypothetical protein FJ303_00095 [Planctomycetes bacterium]|nr:hypothetical protein [Planctomycetota bacterium]
MAVFVASPPLADFLLRHFPAFRSEMDYRRIMSDEHDYCIDAQARDVFGDRVMMIIADISDDVAGSKRHEAKSIRLVHKGRLHALLATPLAEYLHAQSSDLADWASKQENAETKRDLRLTLDDDGNSIELDCRPIATSRVPG